MSTTYESISPIVLMFGPLQYGETNLWVINLGFLIIPPYLYEVVNFNH